MGRKAKTGKQRKDRYYHLAKETGYRSRAAFKLIQLNRKFEFLQRSKVLIDLCAAPGGWLQVAQKYMPVSSVIVGVDLVPIKAIHNVITLQDDITTRHCRDQLSKELKTWKADVVLHDGAPNVGKSWLHDAFGQNRLTLKALALASEHLMKGGWFITKVFRSKDYNALMWVFKKLFVKVHATKPQASRNESAEIFVVCQNYVSPDKIDPKFFDPSYVFEDVEKETDVEKLKKNLLKPAAKQKKAKAEGYDEGDYTMFHRVNASDLISSKSHIEMLSQSNEIVIDTKEIREHPLTTTELMECCKDLKVLGRKELLAIIDWRRKLRRDLVKEEQTPNVETIEETETQEEIEEEEVDEIDKFVAEEAKDQKRKKRKVQKEKRKLNERMNLKMIHKNDEILEEELELFQLKNIRNRKQLSKVEEIDLSDVEVDIEEEEVNGEQNFTKKKVSFDKNDNQEDNDDSGLDEDKDEDDKSDGFDDEDLEESQEVENGLEEDEDEDSDGLIVDLEDRDQAKRDKTEMFFDTDVFKDELNDDYDEDIELELIENRLNGKKQRKGREIEKKQKQKKPQRDIEEVVEDSDEDSDDEENQFLNAKRKNENHVNDKCQKKVKLNPEELALGTLMIKSQKTKRDIFDSGWNRYTHEDDEFLPSWFRKDEEKHWRKPIPVSEDMVKDYKKQLREIDARPIKKVAEARARKKKKALRKMEKARKKAENVTNAPDMTNKEKAELIKSAYKRALKGNKKEVTYVVAKKHSSNRRPQGVKGKYKVVDSRMKKDKRAEEKRNKGKGMGKKGKGKSPKSKPRPSKGKFNKSKPKQRSSKSKR